MWIQLDTPDGNAVQKTHYWSPEQFEDGCGASANTYANGVEYTSCAHELVFDSEDLTGTWYVAHGFQVTDASGNILYVDRDELISRGFR